MGMSMRWRVVFGLGVSLGVGCSGADHRLGDELQSVDGGQAGETGTPSEAGSFSAGGVTGTTGARSATGADAGAPSGPGVEPAGGSAGEPEPPGSTPPGDLTGIWYVTGTAREGTRNFVVELSSNSLGASADNLTFQARGADGAFDVDYHYERGGWLVEDSRLEVERTEEASFGLGIFPIALGGKWSVRGVGELSGCSFELTDDSSTMGCGNVRGPNWMTNVARRSMVGQRNSRLDSSFGDLGGQWTFSGSPGTKCMLTVEGSTISGVCDSLANGRESFEVSFDGDYASGSGSNDFEFSAHR